MAYMKNKCGMLWVGFNKKKPFVDRLQDALTYMVEKYNQKGKRCEVNTKDYAEAIEFANIHARTDMPKAKTKKLIISDVEIVEKKYIIPQHLLLYPEELSEEDYAENENRT